MENIDTKELAQNSIYRNVYIDTKESAQNSILSCCKCGKKKQISYYCQMVTNKICALCALRSTLYKSTATDDILEPPKSYKTWRFRRVLYAHRALRSSSPTAPRINYYFPC